MLKKALTFSYDDGVRQDIRLIELFNKYGMKGTFNLNSGMMHPGTLWHYKDEVPVYRLEPHENLKTLYRGHEVAVHGVDHIRLSEASREETVHEVIDDKKALSEMFGYDICGMAYAYGAWKDENLDIIRNAGIRYSRAVKTTHSFNLWEGDMLVYQGTCHHGDADIFELAKQFIEMKPDKPQLFYIWGHSYEFDYGDDWGRMEELLKLLSGHDDILYGTNKEVFEYFGMI